MDPDDVSSLPPSSEPPDVGGIVEEILRQSGALTVDEIVDVAAAHGLDLGDEPADAVSERLESEEGTYYWLENDRWAHLPSLLDGKVFTHRLSAEEIAYDLVAADPDLWPLHQLVEAAEGMPTTGGVVQTESAETVDELDREIPTEGVAELGSLVLPVGTFSGLGLSEGDLVGLSPTADGITVIGLDTPPEPSAALRDYVLDLLDGAEPQELFDVVISLLADQPEAFADPMPPVREVLTSWDVAYDDGLVAAPGYDFEEWRTAQERMQDEQDYGLDPMAAAVLKIIIVVLEVQAEELAEATKPGSSPDSPLPLADALARAGHPAGLLDKLPEVLADPLMAYAVLDRWQRNPSWAEPLAAFCTAIEPTTSRPARVGLHWLWAKAYEGLGDSRTAETHLRTAERYDPEWPPVLVDLARYAGDRGDAATGLALLRRIDGDPDPFLRGVLEQFAPEPPRLMPRNAPCWCGSGRKFKQCHQRAGQVRPLAERAEWLVLKAAVYAVETPWRQLLDALVDIRAAGATSEEEAEAMGWDGLVLDAVLFEGGVLAEYVDRQGWLLPADELALARSWLGTQRSVYQVEDIEIGVGLTLRDLRSGDRAVVESPMSSEVAVFGELLCIRLLPLPGGGFVEPSSIESVSTRRRDELISMLDTGVDAVALVTYLSQPVGLDQLITREGDPLVLGHLEATSPDPAALTMALDETYQRSADESDSANAGLITWHKLAEADSAIPAVRAWLHLRGQSLTVETMSRELMAAVCSKLLVMQPELTVVSEDYQEVELEMVEEARAMLARGELG